MACDEKWVEQAIAQAEADAQRYHRRRVILLSGCAVIETALTIFGFGVGWRTQPWIALSFAVIAAVWAAFAYRGYRRMYPWTGGAR